MTTEKQRLRSKISSRLKALTSLELENRSHIAADRLIEYLNITDFTYTTIFSFISMSREIDTTRIHEWAKEKSIPIALPRITKRSAEMTFHITDPFDSIQLERHPYGFYQPKISLPLATPERAIILVPGIAFSEKHLRMGRGGGYYDRLIFQCDRSSLLIGFCFEEQLEIGIPIESHDRPVQVVVTQDHIYP